MPRIALKEVDSDKSLAVEQLESLIGRDPTCGIIIDGPKSKVVSGRHARIFFQDGGWWIQDMSRNGTILDDERLQAGQRHALRMGQLIGLGESGPRLRVTALESSPASATVIERPDVAGSPQTTAPRQRPMGGVPVGGPDVGAAMRPSEAMRGGVRIEEPTEPARPSGNWHIQIVMRAVHSDQRQEAGGMVIRVGRSPECHIRIPPEHGASVSRVHSEISIGEAGVVIRDAASRNGTIVNGVKIEGAQPLVTGDKITLGAGGPTLQVDELHIVKGTGPTQPKAAAGIGGGPTPDSAAARARFQEPPTAPAAVGDVPQLAGTRFNLKAATPGRGAATVPPSKVDQGRRIHPLVWVGLAVVIIAAAVAIGRISATP